MAHAYDCVVSGGTPLTIAALRLHPRSDLLTCLSEIVRKHDFRAAFVLTCVGSLTVATLRLANQKEATRYEGHFEIVSLVGTLCPDGLHLHISISDGMGKTIGGHVLEGCIVYTTAEIVLGEATALTFSRPIDPKTTYDELLPQSRSSASE